MGNRYQCQDCKDYFTSYNCRSCKKIETTRCYFCHFDYMNDIYLGEEKEELEDGIHLEWRNTDVKI
jgi:hypothetical protein